ncbi:MAG: 50S ribosomal protein L6 [Acidimicrobiales bacterium]
MSRIGRAPIPIPSGVKVDVTGAHVKVEGPKGSLDLDVAPTIVVRVDEDTVVVERSVEEREARALHGLTRALVANMVTGVSEGFTKNLEIHGVGYRAQAKGSDALELQLGFSHPVEIKAPDGVTFEVPLPTQITVVGIDKQKVGQVAAEIRSLRKPEPYKGKGIRYAGERVIRKAGKAGK